MCPDAPEPIPGVAVIRLAPVQHGVDTVGVEVAFHRLHNGVRFLVLIVPEQRQRTDQLALPGRQAVTGEDGGERGVQVIGGSHTRARTRAEASGSGGGKERLQRGVEWGVRHGAKRNSWRMVFNGNGLRLRTLQRNLVPFPVLGRVLPAMTHQPDPDADLMLRVKQGDREAFAELVEKYKKPVMNLVYRTLPDATEAEDLAQHVFLQVYKSAHRYEVAAKFTTWLFTIARNLCLNEIRRRSRHPADSLDATAPGDDDQPLRQYEDVRNFSPPDSLLHGELEEKIEAALAELPEKQRTAILLCRGDELSYEQIAEVLECSVSATKSLIHRGRETLKQKLKPYLQTGAWKEK